MMHRRCVVCGEVGLDYHYDLLPQDVQRAVFTRQLEHAVRLGKPLTIHTREAEADTEDSQGKVHLLYAVSLSSWPGSGR